MQSEISLRTRVSCPKSPPHLSCVLVINCPPSNKTFLLKPLMLALAIFGVTFPCFGAPKVDFSREVLPILSDNCFYCHGPDSGHRKAKLRLDDETDAKKDRDGEAVIVPGDIEKSLLVARIVTKDEDDLMPPHDSNKKLSSAQIDLLKRWINEGANWGEHWSFTAINRPSIPKLDNISVFQSD